MYLILCFMSVTKSHLPASNLSASKSYVTCNIKFKIWFKKRFLYTNYIVDTILTCYMISDFSRIRPQTICIPLKNVKIFF